MAEGDVPGGTSGNAPAGDGDEAVWRDLIARYDAPAPAVGETPWPDLEDLAGHVHVTPAPPPAMPPPAMPPTLPDALPREPPASPSGLPGAPGVPGAPDVLGLPAMPGPPWPPAPGRRGFSERGPRDAAGRDDAADEHYVPPPPPPLPKLAPVTIGAWLALFGGPVYLLVATATGGAVSGLTAFLAVAAFVGGFAVLILRMDGGGPRDSGPDDGAVV